MIRASSKKLGAKHSQTRDSDPKQHQASMARLKFGADLKIHIRIMIRANSTKLGTKTVKLFVKRVEYGGCGWS